MSQVVLDVNLVGIPVFLSLVVHVRDRHDEISAARPGILEDLLRFFDAHVLKHVPEDDEVIRLLLKPADVRLINSVISGLQMVLENVRSKSLDRVDLEIAFQKPRPFAVTSTHVETGLAFSEMLMDPFDSFGLSDVITSHFLVLLSVYIFCMCPTG